MPFASQKTEAITFPANDTSLAFFGGEKRGVSTAWIVVWSLARSGGPNTHLGWGNAHENWSGSASKSAKFAYDMTSLVCFWSGVKSRGTHWAETSDMLSSLCRMFSTRSWEMPTALVIWLTVKRLSLHHHVVNTVGVSLGGDCGRTSEPWVILQGSPLEFCCPLLHSW